MDALLGRLFGQEVHAAMRAKSRRHLGAITHIFSHIRMTLQAEKLVLEVRVWEKGGPGRVGKGCVPPSRVCAL